MLELIKNAFITLSFAFLSQNVLVLSSFTLKPNIPHVISLNASENTTLTLNGSYDDAAYIICQVHSQTGELSLSTMAGFYPNSSVSGRDIGVVSMVNGQSSVMWYLRLNSKVDTRVLVHATVLTDKDPLPGGCNQEFNLENDPNIHLEQHDTTASVKFQWSNIGYSPSKTPPSCEGKVQATLQYQGYIRYIESADFSEDTYFNTLKEMILAEDAVKHGTWFEDLESNKDKKSIFTISSYPSQGVIYTVVVKETNTSTGEVTQAAYIPVVLYNCEVGGDCNDKNITEIIFSSLGLLVGIFLCFFGHRFFKTENFVFGFLIFITAFYQVLALKTNISLVGILVLTGGLGLVGGVLLLGLWWRLGVPVLNVLIISLLLGYMFSSILFYTPFANLSWWDSPVNYGLTFMCGVLIVPVALLIFTRFLNILTCAVVGSYGAILAIDVYIGSGMKNILINSLRHGTDVDYVKVIITAPFTTTETILTVVWVLLAVSGTIFQLFRERKKAPFPPCPRHVDGYEHFRNLLRRSMEQNPSDTEPLIRGQNYRQIRGSNSRQNNTASGGRHDADLDRGDNPRQPLLPNERKVYGTLNHSGDGDMSAREGDRPRLI